MTARTPAFAAAGLALFMTLATGANDATNPFIEVAKHDSRAAQFVMADDPVVE